MKIETLKQEQPIKNTRAVRIAKKMGKRYSLLDAALAGKHIGIKWDKENFKVGDLLVGMHYELEHGKIDPDTNVTNDNKIKTAKIAWAHLKERPDYYTQLMKIDPPKNMNMTTKQEKTAFQELDELAKEAGLGFSAAAQTAKLHTQMAGMKLRMIPMSIKAKRYAKKQQEAKNNENSSNEEQGKQATL